MAAMHFCSDSSLLLYMLHQEPFKTTNALPLCNVLNKKKRNAFSHGRIYDFKIN